MGRLPNLLRLGSKLVLEILPSIAATVIGGYLLTQLHFSRTAEAPAAAVAASVPDTPTASEERASIRDVLKARRENPQAPEVVRRKPVTTASVPADAPQPAATEPPTEPVERAASRPGATVATAPAPRREVDVPRARPDAAASTYVPAPPPGLPVAPAVPVASAAPSVSPALGASVAPSALPAPSASPAPSAFPAPSGPPVQALPSVVVSTAPAPTAPPPVVDRGPVGSVLSGISVFVGQAANVTGNTVNWVIDLPGKAIEAGGRVIGVTPPPPPPSRPFS
jgi:hypothetical protein